MSQSEASDDMDGWITRYADISKTIDEDTEIPESEKARLKDLLDKQQEIVGKINELEKSEIDVSADDFVSRSAQYSKAHRELTKTFQSIQIQLTEYFELCTDGENRFVFDITTSTEFNERISSFVNGQFDEDVEWERIDEEQMNEIMEDLPEDDLNGLPSKHTTDYGNLLDNINRQIRKFQFSRWVDHLFPEDTEEKKDVLKEEDDEMMMEQKRRELTMQNLLDTEAERNNYQGDDGVELELLDALEFDDDRDLDEDAESSEKKSGEEAEEKSASETPENDLGDSVFAADNSEAGQKPDVSTKSIQKVGKRDHVIEESKPSSSNDSSAGFPAKKPRVEVEVITLESDSDDDGGVEISKNHHDSSSDENHIHDGDDFDAIVAKFNAKSEEFKQFIQSFTKKNEKDAEL